MTDTIITSCYIRATAVMTDAMNRIAEALKEYNAAATIAGVDQIGLKVIPDGSNNIKDQ